MKTFVRTAAFAAALLCVGAMNAQSTTSKTTTTTASPAKMTSTQATTSTGQSMAAQPWTSLNVEHMMTDLGLTGEQTSKLKMMEASYAKQHAAMKPGADLSGLMMKRDMEVKGVLTADQYAKWTKTAMSTAPAAKPATAVSAQPTTKPTPKPTSK
ncbi:MAG: hypothetical protein ABI432_10660 [Flavobacteriales bacterium]